MNRALWLGILLVSACSRAEHENEQEQENAESHDQIGHGECIAMAIVCAITTSRNMDVDISDNTAMN